MKKRNLKRSLALLLAVLLCFSAFAGVMAVPVHASGVRANVRPTSFPRVGDAQYDGNWGHGDLNYMGGWHSAETRWLAVRALDDFESQICYCIEPGVELDRETPLSQKDESFWDNFPAELNSTISPDDIKLLIGRILQYGYTGTVSRSWMSQNPDDADKLGNATATQLLIWEVIVGERDADFNKVSTGGKDPILSEIAADNPIYSQTMSHYHRIEASVKSHAVLPSFMARSTGRAQNVELTWDGSKYTATLTDTNNVLSNYSFEASDPSVHCAVSGNQLIITADSAPSGSVTITASKNGSQRRGLITWTNGDFGPNSAVQDLISYTQSVTDPVKGFLNIKVNYGGVKIVKTSEDGKVSGITFTVTGNGVDQTVQTGPNGEIQVNNLAPGVYTVTERTEDRYEPQQSQSVTVVGGQTATVNFNNKLKRGDLTVTKTSEDGLVEGVTFHLSGTSYSGQTVDEYATTDSTGKAYFRDVLIGTGYTLEETNVAERYVVPDDQTAAIEWNAVTEKSFENRLKKWNATLTKQDSETGTPQGDGTLAGAVYGVYRGEELIDTYTTDGSGQFTTDYYVCGDDWSIREITPSEGYLLDSGTHHVGAEAGNFTVEYNSTSLGSTEQVIKGNMTLIKHTDDGETQLETPEAGAEFDVYLKAAGNYAGAKESERDHLICDENGFAQTKDLPYGVYTVHQTSGWDGRDLLSDFDVFIAKDGYTYRYLANNAFFKSYVKVVKVDAETGKTIPYAGAGFKLYRPDGTVVTQTFTYPTPTTIDTFYTNADGTLVTPEALEYGEGYHLVEVAAPYGYVLDSTPVYFDVVESESTEESGITVIEVVKENKPQKGVVKVTKTGEVFSSVTESGEGIIVYQPVFEVQGLAGAVYKIVAAEDIFTPDGTLRYSAGEVVDTITTSEAGTAESKPIYLGKYGVREVTAPYKFYETAYDIGMPGFDYDSVVQYPFGYGLSYTTFERSMTMSESDGQITVTVDVTNTGSMAGKDVVGVYYNPPYTNGGIEKSTVNLIQFGKTSILEPGASETLTMTFAVEDMASYDYLKEQAYVLEAGDYVISIRSDAHTVLGSDTYHQASTVVYNESNPRSSDNIAATNLFADAQGNVTYLSRTDNFANYDEATAAPASLSMPQDQIDTYELNANFDYDKYIDPSDEMPTTGADNGMRLFQMRGKDYDDPDWEKLLDQLTVDEMLNMVSMCGYQTPAAESVGKVQTNDADGPGAITNNFSGAGSIGFPVATVLACTWNQELAREYGRTMGQMSRELDVAGWYAPGMNLHRYPFGGRNYEYYSECGVLSGLMAGNAVAGAAEKGVYAYIKHFALYDGNYKMVCIWSNEQAIRETYLKPFEICVKQFGANGLMVSWNFLGTTWTGECSNLLNTVLRDEWGFRGIVESDYFRDNGHGFMNADAALANGMDGMLSTYGAGPNLPHDASNPSASTVKYLRTASKNIMYTVVNSWEYETDPAAAGMPAWQKLTIGIDVAVCVALVALEALVITNSRKKAKNEQ